MSNLAEKLPRFIREPLEDTRASICWWMAEAHRSKFVVPRKKIVHQVDTWVTETFPDSVVGPLRNENGPKIDSLKNAAEAAGDELVGLVRNRWRVIRGGKTGDLDA